MQLIYGERKFETTVESVYFDFVIVADDLDSACEIIRWFAGVSAYTFGGIDYSDMVVKKRMIILEDCTTSVRVILRKKTSEEMAKEELEMLRSELKSIAEKSSKEDAFRINTILEKGVMK